jgi:hypothetical protein
LPKLPKGISSAATLASDGHDPLYRRFPSWYMPKLDRIDVFKFFILTSSPELIRSLSITRINTNSVVILRDFAKKDETLKSDVDE